MAACPRRLGVAQPRSAAPDDARLAGLRPPGPERAQAGAEGGAGLSEEAAAARSVGGSVLARQPAAHAAGLLAQRRRAAAAVESRDDGRRQGGAPCRCRGRPGSRPGRSSTASRGGWCPRSTRRPRAPTRWRSRCADDRADAGAGDEHRDVAARARDVLSADGAGQGAGRPRRPEGDPALLRRACRCPARSRRSSRRRSAKPTAPT